MGKYNVVIVGAGSIGALKDFKLDNPKSKNVITHAHAVYNNKKLNLIGIVDIDKDKAEEAAKRWKTTAYTDINDVKYYIDIVVICIDTAFHSKYMHSLIDDNIIPDLVICEKPFTEDLVDAHLVHDLYEIYKIPIAINYTRRYEPSIQILADEIHKGNMGKIFNCRALYNRGLKRDGCHTLDLLHFLFGKLVAHPLILPGENYNDLSDDDLTYPIALSYEKCKNVIMHPVDGRVCGVFEIDIFSEAGRIIYTNWCNNITFFHIKEESTYGKGYDSLDPNGTMFKTDMTKCLPNLYANAIDYLEGKDDLLCTDKNAIDVHRAIHNLKGVKGWI